MLVLTRKVGEKIVIDNRIVIQVLEVKGNRIRLGIESPPGVPIWREELLARAGDESSGRPAGELTAVP